MRRDIRRRGQAGTDEPLCKPGVEAAGDRVFGHPEAGHEGTHLEARVLPRRLRAHHAQLERADRRPVRPQRQHLRRALQHHRAPARAVVDPLVMQHLGRRHAQAGDDARQQLGLERPAAAQRRRREGQAAAVAADAHQADAALLHHQRRVARHAAGGQPGVAASERRVAGKRQFAAGREDAHAVVGGRVLRRQQEGGLGQVGPAREGGQRLVAQALGGVHHGQRVALEQHGAEDVELMKASLHGRLRVQAARSTRASAATPSVMRSGATVTKLRRSVWWWPPCGKKVLPGT